MSRTEDSLDYVAVLLANASSRVWSRAFNDLPAAVRDQAILMADSGAPLQLTLRNVGSECELSLKIAPDDGLPLSVLEMKVPREASKPK
jgi:hypothetical protein